MEKKEVKKWQDEEALRRYRMIAPLLEPDMDEGKRQQLREEAAEKNGVSKRTLYRYEKGYREEGFEGLRPASRTKKRQQRLPENFDEVMVQAVQLKREVPKRSVRQIIKVLEMEGWAQPGVLKPSTMQRHLYDAGLGRKQMKRYAEKRAASSRRFCRPHRMELLQGDIKYGPELGTTDGELVRTYLSSLTDDHSRYIVQPEFYDNQRQEIVEDTFHKAVLKAGKFDCAYLDNGVQYTAVPACGITPQQEWMRDTRGLVFMDVSVVAEAFRHRERRRIDEAGCFSLCGSRYEASAALANLEAEIAYDPMDMETVTVCCRGADPLTAHRLKIGAFASKVPPVPVGMTGSIPETSRLLDALERKYKEDHGQMARALSFGDYGKEGGSHV